jgi:putative methyltransferase (TIGR04325 family)
MSNIDENELLEVQNWQEAQERSKGYIDGDLIKSLLIQFKNELPGRAILNHRERGRGEGRERESVRKCHLLLGWCFSCVGVQNPQIADIGGGNGYMFDWIISAYPSASPKWTVFESQEVASAYSQASVGARVSFLPSSEFGTKVNFDLTIISCTLQYLENWDEILETALFNSKFVLLMRIPLISAKQNMVYVQTPRSGLYQDTNASWPIRFFSRDKFISKLEQSSELIFSTYDPEETFSFDGTSHPLETYLLKSKLQSH